MADIFTPQSKTIMELFDGSSYYQIPSYQRPYAWEDEQVEQLWEDTLAAFEEGMDEYFLGSIILTTNKNNPKALDVIDGQQRLTTLMILFCVLRDIHYSKVSDERKKNKILFRIKNMETHNHRLTFRTQQHNQNYFEQEIIKSINFGKSHTKHELKSNLFLNTAFVFKEKIEKLKEEGEERLEKFTDYLLDNVRLISIQCSNQSFAIKLFQVLNNRGLDLTAADLIKSFLMSKLPEDEFPTFVQDWIAIEEKAKELNEKLTDLLTYYEYYLLASNPKKGLYDELEAQFRNKDPKEIVHQLRSLLEQFGEIQQQKSKELYTLRYLKHDVYWKSILITARLEGWNGDNFNRLQALIRNFYYLYWIAEYTTSKTKQTSFNVISWIKEGKDFEFIKEKLEEVLHGDKVYRRVLEDIEEDSYQEAWCKPTLMLLEYYETDNTNVSFVDLDNNLHVEHILPQGFSSIDYWTNLYDEVDGERHVNRFGNLTILSGNKNIKASNRPFPKKKEIYEGKGVDGLTGFKLTQDIVYKIKSGEDWTAEKITERKEKLLRKLGKILNFDPFKDYTETEEEDISESTKEIYNVLEQQILSLGDDIEAKKQKFYTAFKKGKNFCCVAVQNNKIKLWLTLDKEELDDPKDLVKDVSTIGHYGTGDSEILLKSKEEIPYVISLIKQGYNHIGLDVLYDVAYLQKQMTPSVFSLFNTFRGELRNLTDYMEKINKFFVGFKNDTFNFATVSWRKKGLYLDIRDVEKKPEQVNNDNINYDDKSKTLIIWIKSKEDIINFLPLVKLSQKYQTEVTN